MDYREAPVSSVGAPFLRRLGELVDVRLGLPITSHRSAPVGPALVMAKMMFRTAFQPFINEILRRQVMFNQTLLGWSQTVYSDLRSVESATAAVRASMSLRVQKLEATVERLERQVAASAPPGAQQAGGDIADPKRN